MPTVSDKPIEIPKQLSIRRRGDGSYLITMEREGVYTSNAEVPKEIGEECVRVAMAAVGEVLLRRNWRERKR